jgi:K(+)-stimulated pyrophosphate-energized sodium pump
VTELALILGIQAASLAFAMVVGRSLFADDVALSRFERVARALERATRSVLVLGARDVAIGLAPLIALLCAGHALTKKADALLSPVQAGALSAIALSFGALLTLVACYAALRLGVQAAVRFTLAARSSLDRALSVSVRAAGAAALIGDALSLLGFSLLFGLSFALKGGTALGAPEALRLARELTSVLPTFAVGSALAALIVERAAGTYRAASEVAANIAGEIDGGLSRDDPRNPALIGAVSGTLLSGHASSIALGFALSSVSHVGMLALAVRAVESGAPPSALLVPFVVRAFFVLGSGFGLPVVRTSEMESPSGALLRGHLCSLVVGGVGIAGSLLWLVHDEWRRLTVVGLLGLGGSLVGTLTAALLSQTESKSLGVQLEGSSAADSGATGVGALSGVGKAFGAVLVPVLVLGVGALWATRAAPGTSPASNALATLVFWSALAGMLPYTLAAGAAGATAASARAVAGLAGAELDAQRRMQRLAEARLSMISPRAQLLLCALGAALVTALSVPSLALRSAGAMIDVLEPVVLWSGALGAALVLGYAGASARAAAAGAHTLSLEVGRQLRAARRGAGPVPEDFSPSYKACVDLAAESSRARRLPQVLAALSLPVLLVLAVRWIAQAPSALVVDALVAFVAGTGFAGFAAALTLDAAQTAVAARRLKRGADGGVAPLAIASETLTSVLGHAAAPAAHALVLATAGTALAIAPFLI